MKNSSPRRFRSLIQYSLIACLVLLWGIILLFFYNEHFNSKKLVEIRKQIEDSRSLTDLMDRSRLELAASQGFLQSFIQKNDKRELENYFSSLRNLTETLDSINLHPSLSGQPTGPNSERKKISEQLASLIDSAYKASKIPQEKLEPIEIKNFELQAPEQTLNIELHQSPIDTTPEKKKLLPRLKDAITGNVEVKRDTVYVETILESKVDTAKIKSDIDSTLQAVDQHYQKEMQKFQSQLTRKTTAQNPLLKNYDHLNRLGSELMTLYESTVQETRKGLERQYAEQNLKNDKIRRYTMLALAVMMFVVLIAVLYFTRQSFAYEKQLAEANKTISQNLKFKNRILGMLSHEVRAPLKIITLFTRRIAARTEDEKTLEALKSIEFTNNSLLIQAAQILEYARNQNKKPVLELVRFNLREDLNTLASSFSPYIESKGNEFDLSFHIPSNLEVEADRIKIHQVLTNLLGNANKFTENGQISLHLETQEPSGNFTLLHGQVKDSGIGISSSDLKKIFEPYFQGSTTGEMKNFGAGLGLNLCKEILELLGGKISVRSEDGNGTEVKFELPLKLITE